MSFGESVFLAGFIQKTTKRDLFVKGNFRIALRHQRGKDLEGTKRQTTEAWANWPWKWAGRPATEPKWAHLAMSVPYRLRVCIYAILSSRFNPRAHDGCSGLYKQASAHLPKASWNPNSYPIVRINWEASHERIILLEPTIKRRLVLTRI
jgi:hypothetical protein